MPREIKERQQPTVALSRFDTMRFEAYLAGELEHGYPEIGASEVTS